MGTALGPNTHEVTITPVRSSVTTRYTLRSDKLNSHLIPPMNSRPITLRRFLESNRQFGNLLHRLRESQLTIDRVRKFLPTDLAPHLSAALQDGEQLILFTESPVWATRLRFVVPALRVSLAPLQKIKIRVVPAGGSPTRARVKTGLRVRTLSRQSADQVRNIAATVSDPHLSQALRRLASHSREVN